MLIGAGALGPHCQQKHHVKNTQFESSLCYVWIVLWPTPDGTPNQGSKNECLIFWEIDHSGHSLYTKVQWFRRLSWKITEIRFQLILLSHMAIGNKLTRRKWPEMDCASFWTLGLDHSFSKNCQISDIRQNAQMAKSWNDLVRVEMLDVSWRIIENNIWDQVSQNLLEKLIPKIMSSYIPMKTFSNKATICFCRRRYL